MRSPARAIAWEIGQRHRLGLLSVAAYFIVLATYKLLIDAGPSINLDLQSDSGPDISERFAFTVLVPATTAYVYLLAVFSYGLTGDLAARESMYPARAFTLPVSTAALAGWPMLYGTAAMVSLWLATALFGLRPSGVDAPLFWPALFGAAFLAWTQALTWMPYGLRGLRVIVAVLLLATVDTSVILAIHYQAQDALMIAILAPQLPLAYLAARHAIARSRRGDVPDWRGVFVRLGRVAHVEPRRLAHFPSAARAQVWFEWRQHGRSLPVWVAILLPFELALLFIGDDVRPKLVYYTLLGVLLTPPSMAALVAATISKANPHVRDSYGVTPFTATRPLTSAGLIAAKLKMTIWSTLAAWLLVAIAVPLALKLSHTSPVVIEAARRFINTVGTPRAIVMALLFISLLLVSTWRQLVRSLYIGLSGRGWLIKTSVALTLLFIISILPIAEWILDSDDVQEALWDNFRWIIAVLVGIKMSAAVWIATRVYRTRVLSDRTLIIGAACWATAVLALHAVLVWWFSLPLIPSYMLALVAILAVPLARVSAAPLALAWNRHR